MEELKVFISHRDAECSKCKTKIGYGDYVTVRNHKPICLTCSDLDHLVFLKSADTALTRRSRNHSKLSTVVYKFSKTRNRIERQGVLVEDKALETAQIECAADDDARRILREKAAIRRDRLDKEYIQKFAERVRKLYPYCPKHAEYQIAEHACEKYSGRVGRSADAKTLDENAIRLAVVAHIRHTETNYESLLMEDHDKDLAREMVRDQISTVISEWGNDENS